MVKVKDQTCPIQDEHERWFSFPRKMSMSGGKVASQTRESNHRRHDYDDDRRTRDDQVLLNLKFLGSWRLRAPFGDEISRDHRSDSTLILMTSFQRLLRVWPFSPCFGSSST